MNEKHGVGEILFRLEKKTVGILGTLDKDSKYVRLRVMYYGVDSKFNCYLMSMKDSPKIEQILSSSNVSFLVFGLEDPYDNSWEVEIDGEAALLRQTEEINHAIERLKERNPFADVASESGITGQFDLIKLIPKIVRFRLYGEALKGISPTVLEL
ncbi:MAG: pyridoxamine 5'-phosphate oxidase family protein [Elusimicrobia bacterium]|nr:pyridoxamine 5'-phosphate oxidase family protein [Elusimicrobiota bacterium]